MKPDTLAVAHGASLAGYRKLARELGLDAEAMARRAGIPLRALDDPELPVSARAVCRLLDASAATSGTEDFGLRIASFRDLSNLGPIGLVAREAATAMLALDTVCRYLSLITESTLVRVIPDGDFVVIHAYVVLPHSVPTRQATELSVATLYRILSEILGPAWRPMHVSFTHRPPADTRRHRQFFGTAVSFNTEYNGMVCRAADLNRSLPRSRHETTRFAVRYLDAALARRRAGIASGARLFIAAMLASGRCTSEQLARHLGVDRRTVHRHLADEGETFRSLLQATRMDLARRLVSESDLPLADVATLLGFSAASAFSAWFAKSFGRSATSRRNERHADPT
jgi:AraC-like DNA-binding protein